MHQPTIKMKKIIYGITKEDMKKVYIVIVIGNSNPKVGKESERKQLLIGIRNWQMYW